MNFLNKGLLGNLSLFKEQYVIPIEKYNHQGRQEKLKNLIEPFKPYRCSSTARIASPTSARHR